MTSRRRWRRSGPFSSGFGRVSISAASAPLSSASSRRKGASGGCPSSPLPGSLLLVASFTASTSFTAAATRCERGCWSRRIGRTPTRPRLSLPCLRSSLWRCWCLRLRPLRRTGGGGDWRAAHTGEVGMDADGGGCGPRVPRRGSHLVLSTRLCLACSASAAAAVAIAASRCSRVARSLDAERHRGCCCCLCCPLGWGSAIVGRRRPPRRVPL